MNQSQVSNFYAYQMDNFAQGRFDVRTENGMRVGHVIGGNGNWTAEAGNKVIGHFESKEKCAEAIFDHRGIVSIKAQMAAIIEARSTMLEEAKQDFHVQDVRFLEKWNCAANLVWIVTNSATHLQALDCPFSAEDITGLLDNLCPENEEPICSIYVVDFDKLQVKEVNEQFVRSLVFCSPKYDLFENKVKCHGQVIAEIVTKPALELGYGGARLCNVTVDCVKEPSAAAIAVLSGIAFQYVRRVEGHKFAAPKSVQVRSGSKAFYTWPATEM